MKKLLLILCFLPLIGCTQIISWEDTSYIITSKYEVPTTFDTVPCIMLVCDTATTGKNWMICDTMPYHAFLYNTYNTIIWWDKGYEVREKDYMFNGFVNYTHLCYLDSKRQRFSKDIIVWMSK